MGVNLQSMGRGVVAVVVTYRRPCELARLLASLSDCGSELIGVVIADHSPSEGAVDAKRWAGAEVLVLPDASNPGPGAGWAKATLAAQRHFGARVTAFFYLDDDVVIPPGGLTTLCQEADRVGAGAIAPLLEDAGGRVWGFPEPQPKRLRRAIRQAQVPVDALRLLGVQPIPFCWCTGACFLVGAEAGCAAGLHRSDFWMLGEDLEYSMRVAAHTKAVFTCKVSVPHLPPEPSDPMAARPGGLMKFCSLLQNLSYLSFHSPYSAHMKSYLPGNFRRFFRSYGLGPRSRHLALACFWNGALCGEPSGKARGESLRATIKNHGC